MYRSTCSQCYVPPIFLLVKSSEFCCLSCVFPGMQARIVQELIVAVHYMFLYLEMCLVDGF